MTRKNSPLSFFVCILAMLTACTSFGLLQDACLHRGVKADTPKTFPTVVLDAGHGGEDGGASSADGVLEKDLNLTMVMHLKTMLEDNGVNVVLTRHTDTLLYDRNVDFQGRKKALDMAERLRIVEEQENCIFISVHMNTYPTPDCQGLQVWYSQNNTSSEMLAQEIQNGARILQPRNHRACKAAGGNIYLLRKITAPAVLVECGFLSNPIEAGLLQKEDYQKQLANSIVSSVMQYFSKLEI